MIKTRLLSLMPDLVTDDLIKECCDLFNLNFDKAMNGKVIKYIGIITNNPIMIKILKIQGFSISQDKKNIRIYLRVMNLEE